MYFLDYHFNFYTEVNYMLALAKKIFSRVYQSYLMGGDMYTYYYKTHNELEIEDIKEAIHQLENDGLIDIIHIGSDRARVCITSEGITYGSNNY